jgi:hypothetical protein
MEIGRVKCAAPTLLRVRYCGGKRDAPTVTKLFHLVPNDRHREARFSIFIERPVLRHFVRPLQPDHDMVHVSGRRISQVCSVEKAEVNRVARRVDSIGLQPRLVACLAVMGQ